MKNSEEKSDSSILKSDEYLNAVKEWDAVSKNIQKAVAVVRSDKQSSWTGDFDDYEGNEDDEIGASQFQDPEDREAARRFTALTAEDENPKKNDRNGKKKEEGGRNQKNKKFTANEDIFPSF